MKTSFDRHSHGPRLIPVVSACALAALAACGGGKSSSGGGDMTLVEVTNGFGPLLPHRTFQVVNGQVTSTVIAIRTQQQLAQNVSANNPILPTTAWPDGPVLPSGTPGNHYVAVRFSRPIDPASVLDPTPGGAVTSGLTGAITVVSVDPITGQTTPVPGRGFIGGRTYSGTADPATGLLPLTTWVSTAPGIDGVQKPVAVVPQAFGFPGTQDPTAFGGAAELVRDDVFVFVVDGDSDFATHETMPTGRHIRVRIGTGVLAQGGGPLVEGGLASSTVGPDSLAPEVNLSSTGGTTLPQIVPGNAQQNVDPNSPIRIAFNEPVQPHTIGSLDTGAPPLVSPGVQITFGPPEATTLVPFVVRPVSVYDLSVIELRPLYPFPGKGPPIAECNTYSTVSVNVSPNQVRDLALQPNLNTANASTTFEVGQGIGLVNAPVAPDVIYVGRAGSQPGISVIDLNGFGQGTGNPAYDPFNPIVKGHSNFPNNPNVAFQGPTLVPPLKPGTCTIDGGSAGVFTLAVDSALNDKLIRAPLLDSVGDMMLGQPLDLVFNNAMPPFGCQSGNPNICALSGLKRPTPNLVTPNNVLTPGQPGQFGAAPPGSGNLISWAPHPNPPPLVFPPLCSVPNIGALEPTSVETGGPNLLQQGNPFGNPNSIPSQPPTGLIAKEQNAFFVGPPAPKDSLGACQPYQIRQQIGHFLYVVDRVRRQIVVLNSNRFFVLDRIDVPDPTALAMSPNVDFLAVSNQGAGTVSFIDIRPLSSTFHKIIATTKVGQGPRGICWQPGNEDIVVCNELDNSVSIIRALDYQVRKVLKAGIERPFEVVLTDRQLAHGLFRNVYFGFILGRNGKLTITESGPNGSNGWGLDEVIATMPFTFANPKAMALDYTTLNGAVWIVHENPLDPVTGLQTGVPGGAVSNVWIESALAFPIPLTVSFGVGPNRDLEFKVRSSIGSNVLTGIPVDIAFDNLANVGGLPNFVTTFSTGVATPVNGKSLVRPAPGGSIPTTAPQFMFVAIPNSTQGGGVVDVINLGGLQRIDTDPFLPGVQSIPAPGVVQLMDYFRQ